MLLEYVVFDDEFLELFLHKLVVTDEQLVVLLCFIKLILNIASHRLQLAHPFLLRLLILLPLLFEFLGFLCRLIKFLLKYLVIHEQVIQCHEVLIIKHESRRL